MTTNRRVFLRNTLATGGLVGWGLNVPSFLAKTALAAQTSDQPGAKDTILIVIEMTGGNDGLNMVVPFKDAEYAKLRPTLKLAEAQVKKVNDSIALHPQMTGLADLLQDHALCVAQGVGYPNPSQSHFRSMDIWQTAAPAEVLTEGWLGKALKALPGTAAFHLKSNNEGSTRWRIFSSNWRLPVAPTRKTSVR
jgi:uncharacterized protein (DUF1501 family)